MTSALEAWQAEVGATLVARTQQAATTFRLLSRAIDVLTLMLPGDPDLLELGRVRALAEKHFIAAGSADPTQAGFDAEVTKAEAQLAQLERKFLALDGEVPMDWFKERFDPRLLTPESVVDYAAVLGRHLEDLPQRLDRIEFALTRMVSVALPEGERASPRDLEALFRDSFPPANIDASTRQAAVAFFAQAAERVRTFSRLKELFDSGLFVDVRGYKLSLRSHLLDPDIIAAAIDANRAITEVVKLLIAADNPTEKEVQAQFAEVDAQIRKVFTTLRADETELKARFAQRLKKLNLGSGAPPRNFEQFLKKRSALSAMKPERVRQLVWVALIIVFGSMLAWRVTRATHMDELSPTELSAISPVLQSAKRSNGSVGLLLGKVDKTRWTLLGPVERKETARQIAQTLRTYELKSATLMLDDRVVVHIEDYRVLLVE